MFQTVFRKLFSHPAYICLRCLFLLGGIRNASNHFMKLFYPGKVIIEKVTLHTTAIVREYSIPVSVIRRTISTNCGRAGDWQMQLNLVAVSIPSCLGVKP